MPKTIRLYKCWFKFKGQEIAVCDPRGIGVFKDGFWINSRFTYTSGADNAYWIPPSAVMFIEFQDVELGHVL